MIFEPILTVMKNTMALPLKSSLSFGKREDLRILSGQIAGQWSGHFSGWAEEPGVILESDFDSEFEYA